MISISGHEVAVPTSSQLRSPLGSVDRRLAFSLHVSEILNQNPLGSSQWERSEARFKMLLGHPKFGPERSG
jgi:hypothetical protein